jgi:hypothetical protein
MAMKRVIVLCLLAGLFYGCTHRWVGRPVIQLQKELGRPRRIQTAGPNQIYIYPDTLAGRGEMAFTVDEKGIIRDWTATNNVQGVFGNDVFGNSDTVFGPVDPGP